MADKPDYDVIIIRAGHNGLVASFYLARAGLRVLVVESRKIVGGCCVTEELIPGFRFSTCANVLWALRPKIVRDMALHERGFIVDERQFLRLFPGGRYMLTGRTTPGESVAAVQKEIAKISAADAAAYLRWAEFQSRLIRILGPYLLQPPPRLEEILARCEDREDKQALSAAINTSIAGLTDSFFESEAMRDVSVGADIPDCQDVGSGLLFALIAAMGSYTETGAKVLNGFVRGGMGRLTELMGEAAREAGATILTVNPVDRVLTSAGKVIGVALRSGEAIRARIVVSNLDPKRTFLSLLADADLNSNFVARVRGLQTNAAAGLKFHGALSEIPDYRVDGHLTTEQRREATLILAPSRDYRRAAWRAAERGDLPEEPVLGGMLPSVYDPTLAPPGKYTWSAYLTWAPIRPRHGTWSELKKEMGGAGNPPDGTIYHQFSPLIDRLCGADSRGYGGTLRFDRRQYSPCGCERLTNVLASTPGRTCALPNAGSKFVSLRCGNPSVGRSVRGAGPQRGTCDPIGSGLMLCTVAGHIRNGHVFDSAIATIGCYGQPARPLSVYDLVPFFWTRKL